MRRPAMATIAAVVSLGGDALAQPRTERAAPRVLWCVEEAPSADPAAQMQCAASPAVCHRLQSLISPRPTPPGACEPVAPRRLLGR